MSSESCPCCGSDYKDRERFQNAHGPEVPTRLLDCPHCGGKKCVMCDAGDDVRCLRCGEPPLEDEDD